MSISLKFLIDRDVPISVTNALRGKSKLRVETLQERFPEEEQNLSDLAILERAGRSGWTLVTCDVGFLEDVDTHPCDSRRFPRRVVIAIDKRKLSLVSGQLYGLFSKTIGWNAFKDYDALKVTPPKVFGYRCGGRVYILEKEWTISPPL